MPRRVIVLLLAVLSLAVTSCADSSRRKVVLQGAGATFPAPLYQKWFAEYETSHPEVKVLYQSIGSGGGIQLFTAGRVDFGASDAAMSDEQIQKVKTGGVLLLPMAAGNIVLAYNLPGVPDGLKLSREAYVGIFQG